MERNDLIERLLNPLWAHMRGGEPHLDDEATLADLKEAATTIASLSEALAEAEKKGAEDNLPPDDITETEVRERARKINRDCGWRNGSQLGLHSVIELMVRLGMDLSREPANDRCIYPDCGCDFDATCETGRLRDLSQGGQHG